MTSTASTSVAGPTASMATRRPAGGGLPPADAQTESTPGEQVDISGPAWPTKPALPAPPNWGPVRSTLWKAQANVVGTLISGALGLAVKGGLKLAPLFEHTSDAPPKPRPDGDRGLAGKVTDTVFGPLYPVGKALLKLPLTRFDTPQCIAEREDSLTFHHQLVEQDLPRETADINTPERAALRDQIVDRLYGQGAAKKEHQAWIFIGMPAAGKSTLSDPISKENGAIDIDGDNIREAIPEWNQTHSFLLVNKEKKALQTRLLERAADNGDNITFQWVPGIGIGSPDENLKMLKDKGYTVHMVYLDLPVEEAIKRGMGRFEKTGRFTDPLIELVGRDGPVTTYEHLKHSPLIDDYAKYSTNVPLGAQPILEEQGKSAE